MKLDTYLTLNRISNQSFGEMIGRRRAAVYHLRKGRFRPAPDTAAAIFQATGGQVTPNDFYGIPEQPVVSQRKDRAV